MQQEKKQGGDLLSAATSLAAGGAVALGLGLLTLAVTAWLISRGSLGEDWTARAGILGSFLGCLAGGCYAISGIRSRALLVGLGVGAVLFLLLLTAGLLAYDTASVDQGGAGLLCACLCGGGIAGLLGSGDASKKKRRR